MENPKLNSLFEDFKKEIAEFSNKDSNRTNLYDFEKNFREIVEKYEKEIFQASIGNIPLSKNKKKL